MKLSMLLILMFCSLGAMAGKKQQDFPLTINVVRIDPAESGHAALYVVHVSGDNRELTMGTAKSHMSKKGGAITVLSGGVVGKVFVHPNYWLHLGGYWGRWNADGTLEIAFADERGKAAHQTFYIVGEKQLDAPSVAAK